MKTKILFITLLLLIVGCSKPVDVETLVEKDRLMYLLNSDKPFSGYFFENDLNGDRKKEGKIQNGKIQNKLDYNSSGFNQFTSFYDNGSKKEQYYLIDKKIWKSRNYKGPRYDSLFTFWYENGKTKEKCNFINGVKQGEWVYFDENGTMNKKIYLNGIDLIHLLNNDWCYPSCGEDVISSFKFTSDGTFNYSTMTFGGMSRWGVWEIKDDNTILLNGSRVNNQNITFKFFTCN